MHPVKYLHMNIEILRSIGRRLLREIPSGRKISKDVIGIGASGDKTYPIDKMAEDIILSGLERSEEGLTIISEEIGIRDIKGGGTIVLIDPVDGSRNAISGIPFYCTSIAVADGKQVGDIYLSYVLNLINGDEFWAEKGEGGFLNGERIVTQKDDIIYLTAYEAQSPAKDIPSIIPFSRNRERPDVLVQPHLILHTWQADQSVFLPILHFQGALILQAAGCLFRKPAVSLQTCREIL